MPDNDNPSAADRAIPQAADGRSDTGARILVVDDHEDNIEVLRLRLESWGYRAEAVSDGAAALRAVEQSPPDLILLDVMMPEVSGIEVAQRVKANRSLPFIPIIMQTALDSTEAKVEGLEAGADDCAPCCASSASWKRWKSASASCSR